MKTTYCEVLVPRPVGGTRNHALVKLTIVHDWHREATFIHTMFLPFAISLLAAQPQLPDSCKRTLLMTSIVRRIIEESDKLREEQR